MVIKVDFPALNTEHNKRVEEFAKKVRQLYLKAIRDIGQLRNGIEAGDKPFSFKDFPEIKEKVDKLFRNLTDGITATIESGVVAEWLESQKNNDALVDRLAETVDLTPEQIAKYKARNLEALAAFQNRKINGLGLSKKVWNLTKQYKQEIEMALDIGIGEGRSAQQLSRDLRGYLDKPEKLFRKVRNKHGKLQLSKNAMMYNPGRGVYRSSYKNAMRLARTEINMAYRLSDYSRWKNMDFIIGIEIRLSDNHTLNGHPFSDICDELKGVYPKDFVFTGWHPQCKCHAIPVFNSQEDFKADTARILMGKEPNTNNQVKDLPENFKKWYKENEARIARAKQRGTLPYFLRDNKIGPGGTLTTIKSTVKQKQSAVTFREAKTIREAEEWAKENNLADNVSYSGLDVEVANTLNKVVFEHIKDFPELRKNLQFIGSAQERNKLYIDYELAKYLSKQTDYLKDLIDRYGLEKTKYLLKKELRKIVGRIPGNVLAVSTTAEAFSGISVNNKFGKNVRLFKECLRKDEKSGFHPIGCDTIRSVIDHEMGHEIDKLLGLSKNQKVINLYKNNYDVIATELSRYGQRNIKEFIAESWAELKNNPKPRRLAKELGKIIEELRLKRNLKP